MAPRGVGQAGRPEQGRDVVGEPRRAAGQVPQLRRVHRDRPSVSVDEARPPAESL